MKKIIVAVALLIWILAGILASCGASEPMGAAPAPSVTYVLNTNTHKFHYPDCASVADIAPKNYQEFFGSREEAIALGFIPCKRCNP